MEQFTFLLKYSNLERGKKVRKVALIMPKVTKVC